MENPSDLIKKVAEEIGEFDKSETVDSSMKVMSVSSEAMLGRELTGVCTFCAIDRVGRKCWCGHVQACCIESESLRKRCYLVH